MGEPPAMPEVRDIVARVAARIAIAVVAPSVLFATTLVVLNLAAAMLTALAWLVGAMSWRHVTGRGLSGLLVLTLTISMVKTSITLATGNSFIYFVQPVVVDVAVAAVFLGSLAWGRPLVARLAPDFCPLDVEVAARPEVQRLFRSLTLMWGLVILVKGAVTLWLLTTLSTVDFVLVKSSAILTLTVTAAAATVLWSLVVGRREGVFGCRGGHSLS
ncbi:hypothetical protein GEV29_03010 [Aeromicrobium sp. SMF47]|uniref:VC0807 family protein n=1 Tax=Aeromicrobium TaxID=2040 RepID=UPI00129E36A9|nr:MULTISPECIES: VC0807 family protein [Aeromicrobium]MRJ75495.1 hypothetical protein [Aeromicrobium yanjiei]MRK02480.1 hypothetical protein [Aeromicrobium sp. S22]